MMWRFFLVNIAGSPAVQMLEIRDLATGDVNTPEPMLPSIALDWIDRLLASGETDGARCLAEGWLAATAKRAGVRLPVSHLAEPELLAALGLTGRAI